MCSGTLVYCDGFAGVLWEFWSTAVENSQKQTLPGYVALFLEQLPVVMNCVSIFLCHLCQPRLDHQLNLLEAGGDCTRGKDR